MDLEIKQNTSIFISSCDEFSDLWDPFFQLFKKFWPDCPFPIYLNSVTKSYAHADVQQILVGSRVGWGDGVLKGLEHLKQTTPTRYVLFLLDDYFFSAAVDTQAILKYRQILGELDGDYLRLNAKLAPETPLAQYPEIGMIQKGKPYRLSLQASFWRVETLIKLIQPTDTPWDLEISGSERSKRFEGFYGTLRSAIHYLNAVERGRWNPEALTFAQSCNINIQAGSRPIRGSKQSATQLSTAVRKLIPLKIRIKMRYWYSALTKKSIS